MDKSSSFLSFTVGGELFACSVKNIQNIIEYTQPNKIPGTHKAMLGIVSMHDKVLPVMDMRMLFDIDSLLIDTDTCILVMETVINHTPIQVGVVVDSVSEVIEISDKDVLPSPKIGGTEKSEIVSGIYCKDDKTILLLAVDKLFTEHFSGIEQLHLTVN